MKKKTLFSTLIALSIVTLSGAQAQARGGEHNPFFMDSRLPSEVQAADVICDHVQDKPPSVYRPVG